jgi:AAHS family 4-hydroxybenzoate transporter-like MFS transporter
METSNMAVQSSYTVTEIVEGAGIGRPVLKIIALCFLLMVCDSYDVSALSYAAPSLIKAWRLSSASMGLLFSAGMFGLLVGSVVFGRLGDRVGRKRAMMLGALSFGILTAATGFAQSANQLLLLRLFATLGLGGAVPNAVALITEFVPRARRITAVGAIFAGYSGGGVIAGVAATYLVPAYGWRMLFFAGGGLSLITALAFALLLPESLRYLATLPLKRAQAVKVATYLRPDLQLGTDAHVVPDASSGEGPGRLADLFRGPLGAITPMMWLIYVANSITVFSLVSWMPVVVEAIGLTRGSAALATASLFAGSAVGGVIGGRFADRFGLLAIGAMAVLAFPTVAAIGMLGGASGLLLPMTFLAGCFAFGAQTCLHGVVGSLYPTHIRANGVGWAIGIAKIGSILGPFIGGLLLPILSSGQLFLAAACPLVLVAALTFMLKMFLASSDKRKTPPVTQAAG